MVKQKQSVNEPGPKTPLLLFGELPVKDKKNSKQSVSSSTAAPQLRGQPKEPGSRPHHTDKWRSCVDDVQKKQGDSVNAYAICTNQLGPSIEKNKRESSKSRKGSFKESSKLKLSGRFIEAIADPKSGEAQTGVRFRVVLLQEGLGNLEDCFFYTKKAIESAVPVFEGTQYYVNHPRKSDETDIPERDVRDIAGYFENIAVAKTQDGISQLVGDLVLPMGQGFERERSLMLESINYASKHKGRDLVGLSINANGDFTETSIEQFMKDYAVPDGAKAKLLEAISRGIQVIYPVEQMTSAVSCDMVTVAGAGGRINQLLERGAEMGKQTEAENEKKLHEESEDEGKKPPMDGKEPPKQDPDHDGDQHEDDAADGQDGDHPDEEKDMELIHKMLDEYLGAPKHDDETVKKGKEAYEAAKAMGMDEKEAMKCAGYNMKMAKHMQAKQAEVGLDDVTKAHSEDPVSAGHHPPASHLDESSKGESKAKIKEAEKVAKLVAENAKIKAENDKLKLEQHIEKVLRESGLPRESTKKFRESCLEGVKTPADFDKVFKSFKEGFVERGEAEDGFIINPEKNSSIPEQGAVGGLDLSDCVEQ